MGPRRATGTLTHPGALHLSGAPLAAALTLGGALRLNAETRAPSPHDLHVLLCEETADGVIFNVTDGIRRAAPGRVSVDLAPVCHRFSAGSRLHLLLAGANFPRFDSAASVPMVIDIKGFTVATA